MHDVYNFLFICFQNAMVLKRVYPVPRLPENATQEEIDKRIFTTCYSYFQYHEVEETDAEPGDIRVLLLKSSEGMKTIFKRSQGKDF